VVLLFPGVRNETGITGKDEYWVTLRTPLEMMETASYWTLRLNGEIRLKKPPLAYWTLIAIYKTMGVHLWAARLIGVLSGAGMAFLTTKLSRRLYGGSGFLAGIMVLGMAGVATEGRRAMLDLPLGFFCILSVYLALSWWQEKSSWRIGSSGIALACATLTKGPQSLLFVLPALIVGWAMCSPRPSLRSLRLPCFLFLLVFLVLALPWPLSMHRLHSEFIGELQTEIVDSRIRSVSLSSPLNAVGAVLLLAFPWTFVVLTALLSVRKFSRAGSSRDRGMLWLSGWLVCCVLPFFFMRSFERYLIPILPCVAILAERTLMRLPAARVKVLLVVTTSLLAFVAVVFSGFGIWFQLTFWTSLLTLAVATAMVYQACVSGNLLRTAFMIALTFTSLLGILYPRFGINRLPEALPWHEMHTLPVGVYNRYGQPAMLSMKLRKNVVRIRETNLNREGFDGYIFTTEDELKDPDREGTLAHALRTAGVPYEIAGRYPAFFSRKNWIRFTRPHATSADWAEAFRSRDLSSLAMEIVFIRTFPKPSDSSSL
jgi:4-amino-4-deoxy-L-arabinose transferase-like glycosyltransferase